MFNLHKSTVDTLHARLYSKAPNPDVRRRFDMDGPQAHVAKEAATMIERALSFMIDTTDFHTQADKTVSDYLRAGYGVPWVRYVPTVVDGEFGPEITSQRVELEQVPWSRFHWEPGKDWGDVDWVARDHYLTKREHVEQFGKEPDRTGDDEADTNDGKKCSPYRVTEIFIKSRRKVVVLGWQSDELLEERDDQLGLSGFFPCPRPMMANVKSDELTPMADHHFNKPGFDYINKLTARIHSITAQIKVAGVYDPSLPELGDLAKVDDGTFIPVKDLLARLQNAGTADFSRVIAHLPLKEKVEVVRELQALLAAEKMRLDEQNGIADIVRGNSDPNETAAAQQIKSNYASLRMAQRAGEVNRTLRDCLRIAGEIMAEHFRPEQFYVMTGKQPDPQVMAVLKSDIGRTLSIDIETDSTIALDDEADRKARIEFMNYVVPLYEKLVPMAAAGQMPADVVKATLKFALGTFKHGRELEDAIDAAPDTQAQLAQLTQQVQQAMQQAQQFQQQLQQAQQQLQDAQGQIAQHDQTEQQLKGMEAQGRMAKVQTDAQSNQMKAANDSQRNQIEAFQAETDRAALMNPQVTTTSII